jgi:hypothetical protein
MFKSKTKILQLMVTLAACAFWFNAEMGLQSLGALC